ALVGAFARAALFADEAVAGPRLGEIGIEHLLGALVGERDEIRRSLQRYLQIFDLAEIAIEGAARAPRGLDHDIDEGGIEHGEIFVFSGWARTARVRPGVRPEVPRQEASGKG